VILSTEVEAAVAYDAESVQRRGLEAITNFALNEYTDLLSERRSVEISWCWAVNSKWEWHMHVEAQVESECFK
jgi:hypothetical protein